MTLMRELDVPEDGNDGQIHVLKLKHADAEELSSTLASLAGAGAGATAANRRTTAAAQRARNQNRNAGSQSAALFQGDVKITADKATNSLVITASKGDFNSVKRVVAKLDVARFQVFVEAAILEVSMTRDRDLGVSAYGGVAPTIGGEVSPILFGSNPSQELSAFSTALAPQNFASLLGFAGAMRGPTLEGSEAVFQGGIPAFGVLLQALQTSNDVNVVSTPHILTLDNEEAEIQVNEKRPFPSGLSLGGLTNLGGLAQQAGANLGAAGQLGGLGLGSVSFNREDVGLTLKIKPQINDEDYVRLEIEQELSDVAGQDQATGQTITSKRSAKTVVAVRSQDSVVIGGLVRDRETKDESKTPLLGDLPLIGWAFKKQNKIVEKVNLVLVLTPYIIQGPDDFRKIYERKMEERRDFLNRFHGDYPEYAANINWEKKRGPLATYRMKMKKTLDRYENDGPGTPDEEVIRSEDVQKDKEKSEDPSPPEEQPQQPELLPLPPPKTPEIE